MPGCDWGLCGAGCGNEKGRLVRAALMLLVGWLVALGGFLGHLESWLLFIGRWIFAHAHDCAKFGKAGFSVRGGLVCHCRVSSLVV